MIEKINKFQFENYKTFIFLFLFILFVTLPISFQIQNDPDISALVPDDGEYSQNQKSLRSLSEVSDSVFILIKKDDNNKYSRTPELMNDTRVVNYANDLISILEQNEFVININEPTLNEDLTHMKITMTLKTPDYVGARTQILNELQKVIDTQKSPFGTEIVLSGTPAILDRIGTLLIVDNLNTITLTLLLIVLVIYFFSRNIYFTLCVVGAPTITLVFLSALMVIFDIDITISLAALGVLVLGLGVDYTIHILIHYKNEIKKNPKNLKISLIKTIEKLKIPIFASFLTTLCGFSALIFGIGPSSKDQGIVLSLAIFLVFVITFLVVPVFIFAFSQKIKVRENKYFEKFIDLISNLAVYQSRYPKVVLSAILLITFVMIFGATKVYMSTSNSNWLPNDDKVNEAFKENDYVFQDNSFESFDIVLETTKGDFRDIQKIRDINRITEKVLAHPRIDSISSPFENLEYDKNEIWETLTNDRYTSFNSDFTYTRISLYSLNLGEDDTGKSITLLEIKEMLLSEDIYNTKISYFGDVVRFNELGDTMQKDTGITTIISFIGVFLIVSIIYASLKIGVLSIVPILISLIWTLGFMGFFNVPFTQLSTGLLSLILGIGIDFAIHLVDNIKRNLIHKDLEESIKDTIKSSGSAIFLSSFTTFFGFLALLGANLLGVQRLGLGLSIAIFSVFVVSISLVPALYSLFYRNKK